MKNIMIAFAMNVKRAIDDFINSIDTALAHTDRGMVTAEYAIVLVAATSFAGLLVVLLKSDVIRSMITKLITDALSLS